METIPFIYDEKPIRVIPDDQGEPWFVAKDIAEILGHRDAATASRAVDDDEKGLYSVRTPGGTQEMTCISESGLYTLIFRSDKPEAKPFRKWVTAEVLPSIRKTGSYAAPKAAATRASAKLPLLSQEYRAALALAKMVGITGNAAKIAADNAMRKLGYEVQPLALLGAELLNETQQPLMTPTELGALLIPPVGPREVNRRLEAAGLQERVGEQWHATDTGKRMSALLDVGKAHGDGTPVTQLKWMKSVINTLTTKSKD
jgi:prophage antirepressor-like protein